MALPLLPGNVFNHNISKTRYHKPHHFDIENEVALDVGRYKGGIGGEPRLGQKRAAPNSKFPTGEGSRLPAWIAFDRQVLAFNVYYQEAVHERREEQFRIRNCQLYFYLEDDSIQVIEMRLKNSGLPQGTLIRRHRIPKEAPNDDIYYTVHDFNVGNEINLYGKVFKITGCDEFTDNFLKKLGIIIPNFDHTPDDNYIDYRKAMDDAQQPLRPYEKFDTLKQFLDHDRQVLRFYCLWDDTDTMFGDPRELILHYFLADDTIELREVIHPNSGRDAAPMFVHRTMVPKNMEKIKKPGEQTARTVLNVFSAGFQGSRHILDSLKTGALDTEFYHASDLSLGASINVFGRNVVLCECDEFTKEYYRTKYGITEFSPVEYKKRDYTTIVKTNPPYNGFGSEEDSLCSCASLMPKPPKKDFIKFMDKDRCGLDSNILRFHVRLDTKNLLDVDRRFILSYYLSDDTILIYEPVVRNSGIKGGKFLERTRAKKPNQTRFNDKLSEYYLSTDLYIGAAVVINSFKFIVIGADEYVYKYMEDNQSEFLVADAERILKHLCSTITESRADDVKKFLMANDPTNSGLVPYPKFYKLIHMLDPSLVEHQIMSVARFYNLKTPDEIDMKSLVTFVQEELRKTNYDDFDSVRTALLQLDQYKKGALEPAVVRSVFSSCHIPINQDFLKIFFKECMTDECLIDYNKLIQFINWRDFPSQLADRRTMIRKENWSEDAPHVVLDSIDYRQFSVDLLGSYAKSL